jgi:leucine dehydrogenase
VDAKDAADFDDHQVVRLFELEEVGAHAIIAIHSTHLGPAVGGCRVWRYPILTQALTDALRLSRGMSYKNALAALPFGGGKSVIIPPAGEFDRRALFDAFGRAVESLGGQYITAEDVGSSVADMQVVATQTRHVGGLPPQDGRAGGDPSPWTALGVFLSIEAALAWRTGRALAGAKVTVQGAGAVGADLCRRLVEAGATVTLADVDAGRALAVAERIGAYLVNPQDIHRVAADVFAPCALGAGLNALTLGDIAAPIICGAANNQLAEAAIGEALSLRGKLYCPDYVVNAGGIIAVQGEGAGLAVVDVATQIAAIPGRLVDILKRAERSGLSPETVADRMARERIGRGRTEAEYVSDDRASRLQVLSQAR